jgi:addiction module HigA family antidote
MAANKLDPVHPGEILLGEYLNPLGISQNQLGHDLAIPPQRISAIVKGSRAITVDTALRLAMYFKTTPQFWLNLQVHYDLEIAKENHLIDRINQEVRERTDSSAINGKVRKVMPMPTYKDIQDKVKQMYGFKPKTCWIAHTKEIMGLPVRQAANRKGPTREVPCPQSKMEQIKKVIEDLMQRVSLN